jgi:two-component system response regulator FixJ
VCIVDPDPRACEYLKSLLAHLGAETRTYDAAESFLANLDDGLPACLIAELRLPAMSGLTLLRHLKALNMPIPTILMATNAEVAVAVEAIREGAVDFVEKPCLDIRIARRVSAILSAGAPAAC